MVGITKKRWEMTFKKGWGGGEDGLFEKFLKQYRSRLGKNILDIGFGEGRHVMLLAKQGFAVSGIELTRNGYLTAKKHLKSAGLKAKLKIGDCHKLPYKDGEFDGVISIQVFQFNDWNGAIRSFSEAARVLKAGGIFFLRVKSVSAKVHSGNVLVKDTGRTYKTDDYNIAHFYSLHELRLLAKANHLKIIGRPLDRVNDFYGKGKKGQWNVVFKKI